MEIIFKHIEEGGECKFSMIDLIKELDGYILDLKTVRKSWYQSMAVVLL